MNIPFRHSLFVKFKNYVLVCVSAMGFKLGERSAIVLVVDEMLTMKRGGGRGKTEKVFLVTKIGMPQIKRKGKNETNALPPFPPRRS